MCRIFFLFESRGKMERIFRIGEERVDGKVIEGSEWTMPIRKERCGKGKEDQKEKEKERKNSRYSWRISASIRHDLG